MDQPGALAGDGEDFRLEITGGLDRHAMEALRLEIIRLARQHGMTIERFRIVPAADVSKDR